MQCRHCYMDASMDSKQCIGQRVRTAGVVLACTACVYLSHSFPMRLVVAAMLHRRSVLAMTCLV